MSSVFYVKAGRKGVADFGGEKSVGGWVAGKIEEEGAEGSGESCAAYEDTCNVNDFNRG